MTYRSAFQPSAITSVTFQGLRFRFNLELHSCVSEEFAISFTNTSQGARAASARAFVHSLNILIKYARMYGYDHKRTEAQFETAWNELQQGLPTAGDSGFLLGVSDNKLLLDGVPLEAGNAERSFATLLNTAGLASLHFSKEVTVEDFTRLVRAFTVAGSKATDVAKQIKEALGAGKQNSTIKINEVKFVAADPLTGDVSIAAQIAAQTLGPEFKQWLNDPQKLLQLIAAAEGANSAAVDKALPEYRWFRSAACPMARRVAAVEREGEADSEAEEQAAAVPGQGLETAPEPAQVRLGPVGWFRCRNRK